MNIDFKNNLCYRFDLIIKYLYAKSYLKKYNTDYFLNLYKNHIIVFNGGKEDHKQNVNDFIVSYNNLIEDLVTNGYNDKFPIPIYNSLITNGAHRISASYFLNILPKTVSSKPIDLIYDYNFFYKRNNNIIELNSLESCMLEIIKINHTIYIRRERGRGGGLKGNLN